MKLIAHRGNINGPNLLENNPEYIINTLSQGYDVEIDLWIVDNKLFLGHDNPQYEIEESFLKDNRLWIHAKNFEALNFLVSIKDEVHFFSHDNDPYVLTSKGFIWTYPGNTLSSNSICVMPEMKPEYYENLDLSNVYGICSDFVSKYKNN